MIEESENTENMHAYWFDMYVAWIQFEGKFE